jgi:hypothetical protein
MGPPLLDSFSEEEKWCVCEPSMDCMRARRMACMGISDARGVFFMTLKNPQVATVFLCIIEGVFDRFEVRFLRYV